jgi:YesN/AraC family two-component response regulator
MKLLIADDEKVIRQGLQSLNWQQVGIDEIRIAENGLSAKEILQNEAVDILISDIRMPGMSGIELAEFVRQYSLDTAVIILTGHSDFEYARDAMRNDVYDFMLKPLRPKDILATVANVLVKLEQKRYKEKIVREYDKDTRQYDTKQQLLNCFGKVSAQMVEMLTDIADHYADDISLNELSEKYFFSAAYLSKLFKKETGYHFKDILTGIRLMNAAEMLSEKEDKINVIAENVGFNNQRYFSQVFKKVFDCSPSEFNESVDGAYKIQDVLDKLVSKK